MTRSVTEWQSVVRRMWSDPARGHHGPRHLDETLAAVEERAAMFTCPEAARLAAPYHDAIYDPSRNDNEARSAALMRMHQDGLVHPSVVLLAEAIILATAGHVVPDGMPDGWASDCAIFIDIDMAVLGSDSGRYDEYAAGVAHEYVPVFGLEKYRAGRAAFLDAQMSRGRVFLTDEFEAKLGARAKANMARERSALMSADELSHRRGAGI